MGKAFHNHSGGGSSSGWLVCHFLWERTHPDVQLGAANHDTPQAPRVLLGREHHLHRNLESRVDVQPLNLHRAALGWMSRWRGGRSIAAIDIGTSTMTITSATTGAIIPNDAHARMVCHLRPFSNFNKYNLQRIPREFRLGGFASSHLGASLQDALGDLDDDPLLGHVDLCLAQGPDPHVEKLQFLNLRWVFRGHHVPAAKTPGQCCVGAWEASHCDVLPIPRRQRGVRGCRHLTLRRKFPPLILSSLALFGRGISTYCSGGRDMYAPSSQPGSGFVVTTGVTVLIFVPITTSLFPLDAGLCHALSSIPPKTAVSGAARRAVEGLVAGEILPR